jgi:hypothetical protein
MDVESPSNMTVFKVIEHLACLRQNQHVFPADNSEASNK